MSRRAKHPAFRKGAEGIPCPRKTTETTEGMQPRHPAFRRPQPPLGDGLAPVLSAGERLRIRRQRAKLKT